MKISIRKLLDAVIYVTPNFSETETVRYKFRLTNLIMLIFAYTFITFLFTIIILSISPLKNVVFFFENRELKVQAQKTIELEKKIIFLTKQLESISSTNKKLEYAYILATSDSLDSNSVPYDSLRYEPNKNLPYGGNLYFITNEFANNLFKKYREYKDYFSRPSSGLIINEFNPSEGHFGIDFAVQPGSSIFSAKGGLIIFSDFTLDDGLKIIIQHDDGFITVYKHCSSLLKKERDIVVQGELIALSGNTGQNTTGPHLHFEIWKNGKPRNPKDFFLKR